MNQKNAQERAHQTNLVIDDTDRGIHTDLRERVTDQEQQHDEFSAPEFEARQHVRRGNADNQRQNRGCECEQEGVHDRLNHRRLIHYVSPPAETEFRRENGREIVGVRECQREHIEQRAIEKEHEHEQNQNSARALFAQRANDAPWFHRVEQCHSVTSSR